MQYEMKDSGVEWIGEIPKEWYSTRLKFLLQQPLQYGANSSGVEYDNKLPRYIRITDITKDNHLTETDMLSLPMDEASDYILDDKDILLARSGATSGKAFLYKSEYGLAAFAGYLIRAKLNNTLGLPEYVYYSMLGSGYEQWKSSIAIQSTIPNIGANKYNEYIIPVPSISEQNNIVKYLDEKCAAIDEIIAEAKATIDEYKSWKASVIFEAVTKGLDKNADMKDSGVEWIGMIPKHWSVCKLKWLCEKITDGSHFSPETTDDGYPYITASDVNGKGLNYHLAKRISPSDFEELEKSGCRPQNGDVLLVKDGATTGRVGLMTDNEPCVALSSVAILRPAKTVNSSYLMYLIMSEILQYQIRKSMAGSAMPRTTLSKLVNYLTVSVPLAEQTAIAAYLDEKCAAIDGIIAEKEALIGELENYKKSLIFETVTGKRRVC